MYLIPPIRDKVISTFPTAVKEAESLFNYLNGKINPHNPCVFNIGYFSTANYAHFQAPNLLTVFIGTVILDAQQIAISRADIEGERDYRMSIFALIISHELTHSEQAINPSKYSKDPKYNEMIESSAEYNAEIFCVSHQQEFKKKFKFNFCITSKTVPTYYPVWNYKEYVLNTIYGVLRAPEIITQISQSLDQSPNVALSISYKYESDTLGDIIVLQEDNVFTVYDEEGIAYFNNYMMKYRHGICAIDYKFTIYDAIFTRTRDGVQKEFSVIAVLIDEQSYKPFLFK